MKINPPSSHLLSLLTPRRSKLVLAGSMACLLTALSAQAGTLVYTGGTVTETFNTLGTAGLDTGLLTGPGSFPNDGTSPWFAGVVGGGTGGTTAATVTTTVLNAVSDGSVAVANPAAPALPTRLFNNGQAGVNPDTDRALGSGNTGGDPVFDLVVTNATANPLAAFSLTFDTEFWRSQGGTAGAASFGYQLFASPTGAASSWTAFTGTPVSKTYAAGLDLDGNDPVNRVADTTRAFTFGTPIAVNGTFFIRFVDNNDPTNSPDANIALDNVRFSLATPVNNLVYNLSHTVGGAPNGILQVSPAQYFLRDGTTPAGFNTNDNIALSQPGTATISVPGSVAAGTLTVSNATGLYTLDTAAGATLTATSLNGTAPLAKTGAGTLAFTEVGTATGGLTIMGGTVSAPTSSGIGAITQNVTLLNNATLQFTGTGGAASELNNATTATRTMTIGAGGGTIDVIGTTGAGGSGISLNRVDSLVGSATITKTGGGVLRLGADQTLLTSPWIVNAGALEASVSGALGSGNVTVNPGGTLVAAGNLVLPAVLNLPNNVTLAGGALGARSGNLATFSGAVNVTADSILLGRSNSTPVNGQTFTIAGVLSGSAALTIPGATTLAADDLGGVILTNTGNTYSGNITVTSLQTLTSAPASGVGRTFSTASLILAGGTVAVRDDGAGSNTTLAYGNNVSVVAGTDAVIPGVATLNLDRSAAGATTGNTVAFGTLSIGAQTLIVNGANGYGASFTSTALTGDATFESNARMNVAGAISGAFGVTKTGTGLLTLNGANTFTGPITVNAGTLGGNGSVAGPVTVNTGGTLAPGNSPGIFTTGGDLNLNEGSTLALELAHAGAGLPMAGTDYDRVVVGTGGPGLSTGAVNLGGGNLTLSLGNGIQFNDLFFVVINDGLDPVTGTFAALADNGTINSGAQVFQISYDANSITGAFNGGNDIALRAIPEPTTAMLSLLGAAGMLGFRRRRS